MATHRINHFEIELLAGDERLARLASDRVSGMHAQAIAPVVDGVCEELSDGDTIDRLDRIEVDLGAIAAESFDGDFVARLGPALRVALSAALERSRRAGGGRRRAEGSLEVVETFALTGSLPWWADAGDDRVVERHFARAVEEAAGELAAWVRRLAAEDPGAVARLERACAPGAVARLVGRELASSGVGGRGDRREVRARRGAEAARDGGGLGDADTPVRSGRGAAIDAAADGGARGAEAQPEAEAGAGSGRGAEAVAGGAHVAEAEAGGGRGAEAAVMDDGARGAEAAAADDGARGAEAAAAHDGARGAETAAADGGARGTEAAADDGARGTGAVTETEADGGAGVEAGIASGTARTAGERRIGVAVGGEGETDQRMGRGAGRRATAAPSAMRGGRRAALARMDEIYVHDAGLVMLWPFLARFFTRTGLLDDHDRFVDETAAMQGVALLERLATGEPEPLEFRLPLAKLLCGRPLESDFLLERPLTDDQLAEAELLLAAVIDRARVLGELSVDGFRASFLQRRAALTTRDGAWLLTVERQPQDVLLGRFPWAWSWVKLPWMPDPLRVEW